MYKFDEFKATNAAYELAKVAIEAGLLATPVSGEDAGKNVLAFMNTIVNGLTGKNGESNQLNEQ